MPRSLYLHVPFCPKICPYCDFHKMRRSEGLVAAYIERLEREASALYADFPSELETVYFGGGTPSHLSDEELGRVVRALQSTWGFPGRCETTLEADPLTFDEKRLQTFQSLGFSRLSIGLQSTQDATLLFLGRKHNAEEGLRAVETALNAGFEVSADLITAVPDQDAAKDLHTLAQMGVQHISVYNLTIEPHTPFARRGVAVDPDKEADDYERANEILSLYGLERYEVSSHAKPGHESKHNQVYWRGEHFLALGPSAASFVPVSQEAKTHLIGERRTNRAIKGWLSGELPEMLPVDALSYAEDVLMTGLRTRRGVDVVRLEKRSGIDVTNYYRPLTERLVEEGQLEHAPPYLRTTDAGLLHLNRIVEAFFSYEGDKRVKP